MAQARERDRLASPRPREERTHATLPREGREHVVPDHALRREPCDAQPEIVRAEHLVAPAHEAERDAGPLDDRLEESAVVPWIFPGCHLGLPR
jgi:hypothetical protein